MKKILLYTAMGLLYGIAPATGQGIRVMPGTTFRLTGGPYQMVLSGGAGFENNAPVQLSNLQLKATGGGSNQIKGTAPLAISTLELAKTAGQPVMLMKNLSVGTAVNFGTGLVNLNGFNLVLGDTALLNSESETSRIMSTGGGAVQIVYNLNSPLAENPGNLGLIITSGANWGPTTISRGATAFTNSGGGGSIARSFMVTPTNNTGLSAFLRMYYLDAELNGLNENALDFTQSNNGGTFWTNIGSVSRNTIQNFVNINNVQQMSLFTLTPANNPLPLQLAYFNAQCLHNRAELRWKLANIADVSYFVVQKSRDSKDWENIEGQIPVEASTDHEYVFSDIMEPYAYYRLQSVSIDQRSSWSPVEQINCKDAGNTFRLLENPVRNSLRIGINAQSAMSTKIVIYDMLGRTMLSQDLNIGMGSSDMQYPVSGFAKGSYQVQVIFRNEPVWQSRFVVN